MKRVLVVDDTIFMRAVIKSLLNRNGFEIAGEAEDGETAVIKYKELKPDAVTMDITMPKKNGLEALKAIMEYDSGARIVMLTALGQETMVKEAILLGAKSFILKPFKDEQVIAALNHILGAEKVVS